MQIEHLQEFCELADCLSFTETARRCNTTQSVISKHLAQLESAVGVMLLERTRHKVELTQAGYALSLSAHAICDEWAKALKAAKKAAGLPALRIGGVWQNPGIQWLISDALGNLEANQPTINCTYIQNTGKDALELLRTGEADVAFSPLSPEEVASPPTGLAVLPCFQDQFVAIMRSTHRLSRKEPLHLSDLAGETILRLNGPYWSHGWTRIQSALSAEGVDYEIRSVTSVPGLDFSLIDIKSDLLILSKSLLTGQLIARTNDYRRIPLTGDGASFTLCALWEDGTANRALGLFSDCLHKAIGEQAET